MSGPLRAVADVNVFVSALRTPRGVCAALVEEALAGRWRPVLSNHLIEELAEVLARPAFRDLLGEESIARFLRGLLTISDVVDDPPPTTEHVSRDPDDDYLLALARAAQVEGLVSGDRDLLVLDERDHPVWTPAAFLDRLRSRESD